MDLNCAADINQHVAEQDLNVDAPSHDNGTSKQDATIKEEEEEEKEKETKKPTKGSLFHIDVSQIQGVAASDQARELQGLGISVFDQEEFEQGVLRQVDQAINEQEAQLATKRDEKELKSVLDDIRMCRSELRHLQRVAASIRVPAHRTTVTSAAEKKLLSVRTQKENKAKQLKKLRARHRVLSAKLRGDIEEPVEGDLSDEAPLTAAGEHGEKSSASIYEKLLGDVGSKEEAGPSGRGKETQQERLIRLGEMTPFGTSLTPLEQDRQQKSRSKPLMTDFEKFLGEKDVAMYKKHKVSAKWKGSGSRKGKAMSGGDSGSSSILKNLLTVQPETSGKTEKRKGEQDWRKASSSRDSTSVVKREKKVERKRMEFEPKYKKVKDKWGDPASRVKKRSAGMRDLTENWDSDNEEYMGRHDDDGDEEYVPGCDSEEEARFDDGSYSDEEPMVGRRYARPKKGKLSDEIANGNITSLSDLKRKYGVRARKIQESRITKTRDDCSQEQFQRRVKELKKRELKMKQARIMRRQSGEGEEPGSNSDEQDSDTEDVEVDGGFTIPFTIWSKLYKYQKIGVKWLWELHRQKAGGILGDEMGLGKTIQMIAFLAGLKTSGLPSKGFSYRGLGPVLIVCPATVLHQWVKEFHTWYPEMRVAILHESGSHSGKKEALVRDIVKHHGTLITSFSNVRLRQQLLLHFNWHYVILDEGHKIRNPDAEVTLACKQFRTPHRLILTGSPMQNNLRELWSLIDFVFPGKLGTLPVFMQQFSVPIVQGGYANASKVQVQTAYKCACILRDSVNPYLLRRMKSDVSQALQLPSKNEQVLFCHLTEDQTQVYQDYLASKECGLILKGEYKVFAGLITLRKICNHPDLVSGGPKIFSHQNLSDDQLREDEKYGYWKRAGKMIVVEALLKLWKQQNHRVLLFSQSKQMLNIMESFVGDRYSYMRMDGTTTIASRQPLINKYNSDPNIFLFLLTTRVGGLGVNLTGANRVIIYDPDWNPSTDTQARERSWRIGQNKQVTIYRLLTAGTIEEKIYHRQIFKTFLTNRVLKDPRQRRFFKSNDLFELFTLNTSDQGRSTETSAIFAGTGSDVRPDASRASRAASVKMTAVKLGRQKDEKAEREERQKRELIVERERKLKEKEEEAVRLQAKREEKEQLRQSQRRDSGGLEQGDMGSSIGRRHQAPSSPSTQVHSISSSSSSKKRKKKMRRDASLDGHKIPHLAKTKQYVQKNEEEDESAKNAEQDNYVLQKLFKKSGVHSALQHDNIMQSSNPDFVLVENEADRVAKEAAAAVKQSRRQCYRAAAGIPTWTGAAGGSAGTKPRFGGKANTRLVSSTEKAEAQGQDTPRTKKLFGSKKKAFGGNMALATSMGGGGSDDDDALPSNDMPSSTSLLSRMRSRNHFQKDSGDSSASSDDDGERQRRPAIAAGTEHDGLMTDIVEFVCNQSQIPGQATTGELLNAFESKIEKDNSALFRSMLRQVCTFHRGKNEKGFWRLKAEFM